MEAVLVKSWQVKQKQFINYPIHSFTKYINMMKNFIPKNIHEILSILTVHNVLCPINNN